MFIMEVNVVRCYVLSTTYGAGDLAISTDPHAFDRYVLNPLYEVRVIDVPVIDGHPQLFRYQNQKPFKNRFVMLCDEGGRYRHYIEYVSIFGVDEQEVASKAFRIQIETSYCGDYPTAKRNRFDEYARSPFMRVFNIEDTFALEECFDDDIEQDIRVYVIKK